MDAFSEVLKAMRLESGIFLNAEFTAPWCIDSAPGKDDVRHLLPSSESLEDVFLRLTGRAIRDQEGSVLDSMRQNVQLWRRAKR